jgi:hypothetical protein
MNMRHRLRAAMLAAIVLIVTFTWNATANVATAASGGTQAVAQLRLLDLACSGENDWAGSDEPYITVNGQRVWSASNVNRGDTELVDLRFDFDSSITVALREDDGGLAGGDDFMGSWTVTADQAGTGVRTVHSFTWITAGNYALRYEVS